MKKVLTVLFAFIICSGSLAFAEGDLWDNFGDQNVYGQKPVSDKEFEKALESKKGKKKRDKNIPKGESFTQSNETNLIKDTAQELPILLVPLNLQVNENNIVPAGHYQAIGEKKNGQAHIKLYQAHYLIADIPALETDDDFNQPTISFVKLSQYSTKEVKIIFGSIDFNAYAIVNIANESQ